MSEQRKNVAILLETTYERPYKLIEGILSVKDIRKRCVFRNFMLYQATAEDLFTDDWKPDGIITCIGEHEESQQWLFDLDVPIVNLSNTLNNRLPSVGTDYHDFAKTAYTHLAALGAQSLLFTPTQGMEIHQSIEGTLRKLCASNGLPFKSFALRDQLTNADLKRFDEMYPNLREIILNSPKPIGIFANHDQRGRIIVDYIQQQLGLSIPEDAIVLGCFDSIDARLCDPPLSSIILRNQEIGERGIELLEEMMRNPEFPKYNLTMPANGVRIRESTAAHNNLDIEVLKARQIIRERACQGVTVEQIVAELKVSRSTFEKRFTALTGHSPAQEIREVRVEKARQYLLTTELPLTKIAPLVGFMDRRAFMVFFKRECGMTPGAFRDTHKQ